MKATKIIIYISLTFICLPGFCQMDSVSHHPDLDSLSMIRIEDNQEAELFYNKGLEFYLQGNFIDAIKMFSAAIDIKNDFEKALLNRGAARTELKEFKLAISDFNRTLIINPNSEQAYFGKGYIAFLEANYNLALNLFAEANNRGFSDDKLFYYQGVALFNVGKLNESVESFTSSILIRPNSVVAYNDRGSVYRKLEKFDKAIEDYNKAIEINPNFELAYSNLGGIWRKQGEFEKALQVYNKAILIAPNDYIILNNRGILKFDKKDFEGALDDFKKTIELNRDYALAYNNMGATLMKMQDYKTAFEAFTKALIINPDYSQAYLNRGCAAEMLRNVEQAIADWQKALNAGLKQAEAYIQFYK